MPLHELLAEDLGGLEPGGAAVGTPNGQTGLLEQIDDPQGERVVRTHHGQVGLLGAGELEQGGERLGADGDAFGTSPTRGQGFGGEDMAAVVRAIEARTAAIT